MVEQLVDPLPRLLDVLLLDLLVLELALQGPRLPPEAVARGWQLLRPSCPALEAVGVRLTRLLGDAGAVAVLDDAVDRAVGSLDGIRRHLGENLIKIQSLPPGVEAPVEDP